MGDTLHPEGLGTPIGEEVQRSKSDQRRFQLDGVYRAPPRMMESMKGVEREQQTSL